MLTFLIPSSSQMAFLLRDLLRTVSTNTMSVVIFFIAGEETWMSVCTLYVPSFLTKLASYPTFRQIAKSTVVTHFKILTLFCDIAICNLKYYLVETWLLPPRSRILRWITQWTEDIHWSNPHQLSSSSQTTVTRQMRMTLLFLMDCYFQLFTLSIIHVPNKFSKF